jgi:ferredoxin
VKVTVKSASCEGFGNCAVHAPEVFELDDWGYAKEHGDGSVPKEYESAVKQAIANCPVHAIITVG